MTARPVPRVSRRLPQQPIDYPEDLVIMCVVMICVGPVMRTPVVDAVTARQN